MYVWPVGLLYFLFLGTRTVFFLYLCFGIVLIWTEQRNKVFRIGFIAATMIAVVAFSNAIFEFLQRSFTFISGGSITVSDFSNVLETDTLGFRVVLMWGTILSKITTPLTMIFGLSRVGFSLASDASEVPLTATHNAFIYFFAVLGALGLLIYSSGFVLMIKSYRTINPSNPVGRAQRVNYGMVITTMLMYSLMNNAYGIQGMLMFLLIIAYGAALWRMHPSHS